MHHDLQFCSCNMPLAYIATPDHLSVCLGPETAVCAPLVIPYYHTLPASLPGAGLPMYFPALACQVSGFHPRHMSPYDACLS